MWMTQAQAAAVQMGGSVEIPVPPWSLAASCFSGFGEPHLVPGWLGHGQGHQFLLWGT